MLELQNITRIFKVGNEEVHALNDFSYRFENSSLTLISGPSGSGKSTLLKIIGALDNPTSGKVYLDGKDIVHLSDKDASFYRFKEIGFIFQSYQLVSSLNVLDNVMLGATIGGRITKGEYKILIDKAYEIIDKVGLSDRIKHKPNELSGGQQQRVAIARALVKNPSIILADEPTANLDSKNAMKIIELLQNLNKEKSTICIIATHDNKIGEMIEQRVCLEDGKIKK